VDGNRVLDEDDDTDGATISIDATSGPFIGDPAGEDEPVDGTVDELRVSHIERSAEWIQTEYNNQYSPSTFHTVGSEEENQINRQYRKNITINCSKITGDLTNYPVLVSLTDSDLSSKARSDGYDITFTLSDGTRLDYEYESYDNSTGALVAWVRIPSLSSSTDTTIYMYYGHEQADDLSDPTDVWDSNFVTVWHLKEDPSDSAPQIGDSTSNDNDGTTGGSMTSDDQVTGKIDGSIDFDGTSDNVTMPTNGFSVSSGTIEAWVNLDSFPDPGSGEFIEYLFSHRTDPTANRIYMRLNNDTTWGSGMGNTFDLVRGSTLSTDTWYHLVFTWNGTHVTGYLNGSLDFGPTAYSGLDTVGNIRIMAYEVGDREWADGTLDELRVSKTNRSADWITTEYNNMNDTSSFL
jgi:hypothetical protein